MSVKNSGANRGGEVVKAGLLKKLKTSKKKWFVLRAETPESSARLEYYDTEKKFSNGLPPKRSIPLKTCFNINKRLDTKHKHVIALYTKDDRFCMVLDSEEECEAWLKALLSLQLGEETPDGETPRPTFEHVWQVAILKRGLGTGMTGSYRLCLTDKTLTLIKKDGNNLIIDLSHIRSCGSLNKYFFLEIGRSSLLGAGELWMESEDSNIAHNIHTTIFHAMSANPVKDDFGPKTRIRSASDTLKPNNVHRKPGVTKPHIFPQGVMGGTTRERCDSMPSRPHTTSEGAHPILNWRHLPSHRSHGRDISHSPTSGSPVSPPSVGCSTDSTGSSYSLADEPDGCLECSEGIRYSVPLTPDEAIEEEDYPESPCGKYERYVPMAPQSDDGYVDMSPRYHPNAHSPTASMSSITSGTPSTDMRFCDYPLDKVPSYFPPEDDDDRPTRAYSVGSRPETFRNKRHMELTNTPDPRSRAYSVGSKTKKGPSRVLPPHHPHHGIKSNSAPILSNSRTHSSHSSIGPMDDLMEMDFSRSNTGSSTNSGYLEMKPPGSSSNNNNNNNNNKAVSGYVEMRPGGELSQRRQTNASDVSPYVDMTSGAAAGYMDMSGSSPSRAMTNSPQDECSSFIDINRQYRLLSNEPPRNNNYVDMDHRRNKTTSSPASFGWSGGDYLDMTGAHPSSTRQSQSSQLLSSSPGGSDLLAENQIQPKTVEGYVEMTLGNKKHQRQPSLDYAQMGDEYTNMSLGTNKKKPAQKASQPISIHPTTTSSQVTKNSSSPISISSLLGRKPSMGTPPKMHLPLSWSTSPYSSLPRQRNRKDSQQTQSKDSSSSSVTTPSSSTTIFPLSLNSPSSPMKPADKAETPSSLKLPAAILNAFYKNNNVIKPGGSRPGGDYASMDFEVSRSRTKTDTSDYVNYAPAQPVESEPMDDYAMMQPGTLESAKVTTCPIKSVSSEGVTSPLIGHLSSIGIKENQSMCFRPIKEDKVRFGGSPPLSDDPMRKPEDSAQTNPADLCCETARAGECVSPAAKISRPNSVNSDNTTTTKNSSPRSLSEKSRPASVSSDTSKNAVSRPSSTSSELWSSSSTLLGSSRPESSNSDAMQSDGSTPNSAKLHYASLDLAQSQEDEESGRSPRAAVAKGSPGEAQQGTQGGEPTFVYAEIDFVMSEGLKQNNQSLPTNAKVKH